MKSISYAISRAVVGATMVVAASQASALTLPTTLLDANATLSFSQGVQSTLSRIGVSISALGTTTNEGNGVFNLPITSVTGNIDLFSKTLFVPTSGVSNGAGLILSNSRTGGAVGLANFSIDFESNIVYGDVFVKGGTTVNHAAIYTFDVTSPFALSYKILPPTLDFDVTLGNLKLTDSVATTFAAGLGIPDYLVGALTALDYGTISNNIHSGLRLFDAPSGHPITKVNFPVPEPSTYVLIGMGLVTAGWMASRRRVF